MMTIIKKIVVFVRWWNNMNEIEILILAKISELDDIIQSVGKHWAQSKNPKDLDYVCRRIEAKYRLYNYLDVIRLFG